MNKGEREAPETVYIVADVGYEHYSVDSIWTDRELAIECAEEAHREQVEGMAHMHRWEIEEGHEYCSYELGTQGHDAIIVEAIPLDKRMSAMRATIWKEMEYVPETEAECEAADRRWRERHGWNDELEAEHPEDREETDD